MGPVASQSDVMMSRYPSPSKSSTMAPPARLKLSNPSFRRCSESVETGHWSGTPIGDPVGGRNPRPGIDPESCGRCSAARGKGSSIRGSFPGTAFQHLGENIGWRGWIPREGNGFHRPGGEGCSARRRAARCNSGFPPSACRPPPTRRWSGPRRPVGYGCGVRGEARKRLSDA